MSKTTEIEPDVTEQALTLEGVAEVNKEAARMVAVTNEDGITAAAPEASPLGMMMQAKQAGFSIKEIRAMMDLQERNDKRIAKQAFDKAMADFKRNPPKVIKDKQNTQYDSWYVSIGNMVNTVNQAMGPFGLNARWEFPKSEEAGMLVCTCVLAHELGHEERVTLDAEIDTSGAKNKIQQRRSTRTYLRTETFEAVTGMASEYNLDDDGNAGHIDKPIERVTDEQANTIHSMIVDNELDMDTFMDWLKKAHKVSAIDMIPAAMYTTIVGKLEIGIKAKEKQNDSA